MHPSPAKTVIASGTLIAHSGMPTATISPAGTRRRMSASKIVVSVVALALAAVLLYFSLRGIEWRDVWKLLSGAKPGYLALALSLATLALVHGSVRWRILRCSGGAVQCSTSVWATSERYCGNNILHARGGEHAHRLI